MMNDLVHALSELGVLVWKELRPHADVAGTPALASVVAAVHTPCRESDEDPILARRVEDHRVKA